MNTTIPRLQMQFDDACYNAFYNATGGIPAFASRLHVALQNYFLDYENESLSPKIIIKVSDKALRHEKEMLKKHHMSEVGDCPFEDFYPVGFFTERKLAWEGNSGVKIAITEGELFNNKVDKVYNKLIKLGPNTIFDKSAIEETIKEHPEWESEDAIFYWIERKGLIKKEKKARQKLQKVIDFPEGVSKSYSTTENIYEALQEKGLILDVFSSYPLD